MLDLDMIEEMEVLLTTAAANPTSEQGQAALQKAAHLWKCYADGVRAGLAHVQAMAPGERERFRERLLVELLVPQPGATN